jgi:hypothetical protein
MATHPDAKRKDVLEQIARQAMQAFGFLPDFSADALGELKTVRNGDRGAEPAGMDLRHLHGRSQKRDMGPHLSAARRRPAALWVRRRGYR